MNSVVETYLEGHDKRRRREDEWAGIIIHHTGVGGRKEISEALWAKLYRNLTAYLGKKDKNYVSSHYTIGRNGEVTQIVDPDKYEAWHAGRSSYWHPLKRRVRTNWNRYAVGIEIIGDGNLHKYSEDQYRSLARLCAELMHRYPSIHPLGITGHENIAPDRKSDPGKYFDWHHFFNLLWCHVRT